MPDQKLGVEAREIQTLIALLDKQPRDHGELAQAGRQLRQAGFLTESEELYRLSLTLSPNNAGYLAGLAHVYRQKGDREESLRLFSAAATASPNNANLRVDVATDLKELGRTRDAEKVCREALQIDSKHIGALRLLSDLLRGRHADDEAVAIAMTILDDTIDDMEVLAEVGNILRRANQIDNAERAYRRIIRSAPNNLRALTGLGHVLRQAGRMLEALEVFNTAHRIEPLNPNIAVDSAYVLKVLARREEAKGACEKALIADPAHVGALRLKAAMLKEENNFEEGIDVLEFALRSNPRDNVVRIELGHLYRLAGQLDKAEEMFQLSAAENPHSAAALSALGRVFQLRGQHYEAIELFAKAQIHEPNDPYIYIESANAKRQVGDLLGAEADFRSSLERKPKGVGALTGLGHILRLRSDREGSLSAFSAAALVEPRNPNLHIDKAQDLRELGRFDEAEAAARAALALKSDHPAALQLLAALLRRRGAFEEARAVFDAAAGGTEGLGFLNEHAHFLLQTGALDEAEAAFARILNRDENHKGALSGLGHLFIERLDLDAARRCFERLLAADPKHVGALVALGHIARRTGDRAEALRLFEAAAEGDPLAVHPRLEIAAELRDRGDFAAAKALLDDLVARLPGNLHTRLQLGHLLRRENDRAGALRVFEEALHRHPHAVEPLIEAAIEHRHAGRPYAAQMLLDRAIEREPFHLGALMQALEFARLAEDAEGQRRAIAVLLERFPHRIGVYPTIAHALAEIGEGPRAYALLDEAEARFGKRAELVATRAALLRQDGEVPKAAKVLGEVVPADAGEFHLFVQRVLTALALADWGGAAALLSDPPARNTHERSRIAFLRGQLADGERRYDTAIGCYREALLDNPEDGWLHAELARALLMTLDLTGARTHLTRSVTLNASANILRGQSLNISQHHLGQILDEFAMDRALLDELRAALAREGEAALGPLAALVAENPDHTPSAMLFLTRLRQLCVFPAALPEGGTPQIPKRLAQYWNDETPPEEIAALMAGWRAAHPDWDYERYDDRSAFRFVRETEGEAAARALRRCEHPAQRADVFRLVRLAARGGVYIDADDRCLSPLDPLVTSGKGFIGYQENYGTVGNNMLAVAPGHPVIRRALDSVVEAINRGDKDNLWLGTGPGLITRSLAAEIAARWPDGGWREGLHIFEQGELQRRAGLHVRLVYKKTERHWGRRAKAKR